MTSELRVMSDRIEGVVEDVNENNSKITQTVSQLQTAVNGKIDETEAQSLITQTVDKISMEVSSGSGGSSFVLKSDGVAISSQKVDLHVNALNVDGEIVADAINLSTATISGTLSAQYIDASNLHVNGANIDNLTVTNAQIDSLHANKIVGGSVGGYVPYGAISDNSHHLASMFVDRFFANNSINIMNNGDSDSGIKIDQAGIMQAGTRHYWSDIFASGGAVFG